MKLEMLKQMESMTGMSVEGDLRKRLIQGPDEREIVRSALEQTMNRAYKEIRRVWKNRNLPDLRTACFLMAIERVGKSYQQHGIFP